MIVLTLPGPVAQRYREALTEALPALRRLHFADNQETAGPFIGEAHALVTFGPMVSDQVFAQAKKLRFVQSLGSGVDGIIDQPSLRRDILVCNMKGVHGAPMAESAIASMLALSRDYPRVFRARDRHAWERWPARLIEGKTLVVVGVGQIAEALAPRAKALGMRVVGVTGMPRPVLGFDAMRPTTELAQAVAEADHLVLLSPHTPATDHMIDARIIAAAMKPTALSDQSSRGGVLDESALLEAVRWGKIGGAALDVFDTEPLPADHPFWTINDVIITSHLGGFFDGYPERVLPIAIENLRRFFANDTDRLVNKIEWCYREPE